MAIRVNMLRLPETLALLDFRYSETHFAAKLGDYRSHLSMAPADYFRRNVRIGASCMPRREAELRYDIELPFASVAGTVFDSDSEPAAGVRLRLQRDANIQMIDMVQGIGHLESQFLCFFSAVYKRF